MVGMAAGVIGGFVLASAHGFGFLTLWLGFFFGGFVGEAVLRAVYRKRGPKVEITAGACALLGALAGLGIWMITHGYSLASMPSFLGDHPMYLGGIGIGVFAAVSRVRFI